MAPGTRKPQVTVAGSVIAEKFVSSGRLLLKRRSLPLAEILKQMNVHSDNEMAQMLADDLGGAKIVQQQATWAAGVPEEELQLVNGSGLGVENQDVSEGGLWDDAGDRPQPSDYWADSC
jgi:D-alanyl-D-alanine carboxypeptidase (penicillin-binding protein 4)